MDIRSDLYVSINVCMYHPLSSYTGWQNVSVLLCTELWLVIIRKVILDTKQCLLIQCKGTMSFKN